MKCNITGHSWHHNWAAGQSRCRDCGSVCNAFAASEEEKRIFRIFSKATDCIVGVMYLSPIWVLILVVILSDMGII